MGFAKRGRCHLTLGNVHLPRVLPGQQGYYSCKVGNQGGSEELGFLVA